MYSEKMTLPSIQVTLFCLIAILSLFQASCGTRTGPVKNMDLASLLDEAEKKSYLVNQFRTEFVKTRRNSSFKREMTVKGALVFQKPDKFQLSISGDVNVDVLSNGRIVSVVHDQKDQETYQVHGERDLSKMADPVMLLVESLSNGGLRRFKVIRSVQVGDTLVSEIDPSGDNGFGRIAKAVLTINDSGQVEKARIDFKNGDVDEIEFKSWSLLAHNDPEIISLNDKLGKIEARRSNSEVMIESVTPDIGKTSLIEAARNGARSVD